jgi:hypothetical protein
LNTLWLWLPVSLFLFEKHKNEYDIITEISFRQSVSPRLRFKLHHPTKQEKNRSAKPMRITAA